MSESVISFEFNNKNIEIKIFTMDDLCRIIRNSNYDTCIKFLESLIITPNLNRLEKFASLLYVYKECINPIIDIQSREKEYAIGIDSVISYIDEESSIDRSIKISYDGVVIDIGPPTSLESKYNTYIITKMRTDVESINLNIMSYDEQTEIYNSIAPDIFISILSTIKSNTHKVIYPINSANPVIAAFHLFNNDMRDFIVRSFKCMDLIDWREQMFILSKRLDSSFLLSGTLKDANDYMKLYNKEISDTNDKGGADKGLLNI